MSDKISFFIKMYLGLLRHKRFLCIANQNIVNNYNNIVCNSENYKIKNSKVIWIFEDFTIENL